MQGDGASPTAARPLVVGNSTTLAASPKSCGTPSVVGNGASPDAAAPKSCGRPLFVLFGSSIVQYSFSNDGWGAILADVYSRTADILVRGYSGWNSRRAVQVLDQVFPKDAPTKPSLVVVYFGGNDSIGSHPSGLGPHVPLQEYIENMKKIANHLKSLSENIRIIFLSCPPINEEVVLGSPSTVVFKLERTNERCQKYSNACVQLCRELNLKVVDLWNAIQKKDKWKDVCFTDGIHFSSQGSKVLAEEILKIIKEANWEPSLHWKSLPVEFGEDSPWDVLAIDENSTINLSQATFYRKDQWD